MRDVFTFVYGAACGLIRMGMKQKVCRPIGLVIKELRVLIGTDGYKDQL